MSQCDNFRDDFSDYMDGELHADSRSRLENHVSSCAECSETLTRLQSVHDQMVKLPTVGTSASFNTKLHQRINGGPATGSVHRSWHMDWKIPAMGTAVAAMLIVGVMMYSGDPDTSLQQAEPIESSFSSGRSNADNVTPDYQQNVASETAEAAELDSTDRNLDAHNDKIKVVNQD